MSQAQKLREFVRQRLNAAMEEILVAFDQTIVKYEEEAALNREVISRQHALICSLNKPVMDGPAAGIFTRLLLNEDVSSHHQNQNLSQDVVLERLCGEDKQQQDQLQDTDEVEIIKFTYNSRHAINPREDSEPSPEPGPVIPNWDVPPVLSSETEDSEDYSKDSAGVTPAPVKLQCFYRPKERFSCQACSRTFEHRRILFRHVRAHIHDENQVCGLCGEHFGATGGLKLHLQTHLRKSQLQNQARTRSREKRLQQLANNKKNTETEKPNDSAQTLRRKRPVGRPRKQKQDQHNPGGAQKRKKMV